MNPLKINIAKNYVNIFAFISVFSNLCSCLIFSRHFILVYYEIVFSLSLLSIHNKKIEMDISYDYVGIFVSKVLFVYDFFPFHIIC